MNIKTFNLSIDKLTLNMNLKSVNPMNLGFIGAGASTQNVIGANESVKSFKLRSAFDVNKNVAGLLPSALFFHNDLKIFLADSYLDVVFVASPSNLHYEHCCLAARAKKKIIVEKPGTTSLADYKSLKKLCFDVNIPIFFAFHAAYGTEIERAKNFLLSQYHKSIFPVKVMSTFFDPYFGKNISKNYFPSLLGSWFDSGPNALSVLITLFPNSEITLSKKKHLNVDNNNLASFVSLFITPESHPRVQCSIHTDWRTGKNNKKTLIEFSDSSRLILDHTGRNLLFISKNSKDKSVIYQNETNLDRLPEHYSKLLIDAEKLFEQNRSNWEFSDKIHKLLFLALK